ncbi:hypothetical protein M758_2G103800 [Ceratodon purpureus]|nr:hypothetical protein M758_2G103800 [Ceratodon purpureus]
MMADFDLMELAPEQQEDLAYLHQQLFSTATEVVAAPGEPAIVVTDTTAATVTMIHDGNYGNGNTATEPKEDDKAPAVNHGDGATLVGRLVVKKFKRTKYAGEVVAYDPECKWYKVKYDDDDEEELEFKELEPLLVEADEAEAVRAANIPKKRTVPETDSDSKSPAKRPRGRPPGDKKTPAKATAEKKAKAPKSPKTPKSPKKATPKKSEEKEVSESLSTEKKSAATPASGEKRGRGRPRKDATVKSATKADAKGSGDSSSESKPSTRKSTSAQDKGESRSGRSPRGKSAVSPAGGALSEKEGAKLIGSKIRKKFDDEWFDGEVKEFDPKMGYYKVKYSDGDTEECTLKELKKILVDDQSTPKTRGRSKAMDVSPAKSPAESPAKKQKVSPPKKDDAKTQSPARDGAQPRKRGRPAKAKR